MKTAEYKNIVKLLSKYKFSDFDLISNYGLTLGDKNIFKIFTIYEIIKKISKIEGDIVEFGVWKGNNSFMIKKILDFLKIKKTVYLFDHFKGLTHYTKNKDPKISKKYYKKYSSNKNIILDFKNFFNFYNFQVIDQNACEINKNFIKKKLSFVYMDMDLYRPTINVLNVIENLISKGGCILFDQGNKKLWDGEKRAIKEFLKLNKNKYKYFIISKNKQPDVLLVKK